MSMSILLMKLASKFSVISTLSCKIVIVSVLLVITVSGNRPCSISLMVILCLQLVSWILVRRYVLVISHSKLRTWMRASVSLTTCKKWRMKSRQQLEQPVSPSSWSNSFFLVLPMEHRLLSSLVGKRNVFIYLRF